MSRVDLGCVNLPGRNLIVLTRNKSLGVNSRGQFRDMNILAISLAHDPSAVLLAEGAVIAAIEEGKLLRTRKCEGIPRQAIDFALKTARAQWKDIGLVAVSGRPVKAWARQALFRAKELLRAPISSIYYQVDLANELSRQLNNLRILGILVGKPAVPVIRFEHSLCHAASAFYASPFDSALILTLDDKGDGRCGLLAEGEGSEIRELRSIRFPNSVAWVYSQVTELLGFQWHSEEHKTQWLSMTGEPVFSNLFLEILRRGRDPWPSINPRFFRRGFAGQVAFSDEFYQRIGILNPAREVASEQLRANIAASVQRACSIVVTDLLEHLRKQFRFKSLCLAGGLFLNPLIVSDVERNTGFDQVFVQPAAGNEGTALGAAWLAWHKVQKKPRSAPIVRLDWGPGYSNEEIKNVLDNCKTAYRWVDSDDRKIEEAVRLLCKGKIVAWFQGAAEFGPRALGNRSLLASPWADYVKENLNDYVKHREFFRPFALSIPEEDHARFFECSPAGQFMATMGFARRECREMLREFLLQGDQIRLHLVQRAANPLLWKLLKRFGENAPAPLLVNTSFNLFGEPLVITPRDAVRSYFCSGVDALIAGNFVLTKS